MFKGTRKKILAIFVIFIKEYSQSILSLLRKCSLSVFSVLMQNITGSGEGDVAWIVNQMKIFLATKYVSRAKLVKLSQY